MTKKHFEAIAAMMKAKMLSVEAAGATAMGFDEGYTTGYLSGLESTAESLADYFAEENPRFSRVAFLTACGVTS